MENSSAGIGRIVPGLTPFAGIERPVGALPEMREKLGRGLRCRDSGLGPAPARGQLSVAAVMWRLMDVLEFNHSSRFG
jgi:hypothetical protein